MKARRVAILCTHPIQYHSGWFKALAAQPKIDLEVLFCRTATSAEQAAAGFAVEFDWDVALLDGYQYRFLKNIARNPSVARFSGLDTPELLSVIERETFDAVIIIGWHYKSAWQALWACWKTKTPVMMRSDSNLHTERSLAKKIVKKPFYSWFIPKLDACLPVGTWSRDYFLHYGARPDRIFIVPHVVDVDFFRKEAESWRPRRSELRRRWHLVEDATVFLFAGKFIPKKRPLDFVHAIASANSNGNRIMGLMVGDGPLREACEETVRVTTAPIRFAGFLNQSEIPSAYSVADALVLPSDGGETWGLVVNEAMASGRPSLVSDRVGCGPELIVPGETGEIFACGDTRRLASLLGSYGKQRDRLKEMGVEAEQKTTQHVAAAVRAVISALDAVNQDARK